MRVKDWSNKKKDKYSGVVMLTYKGQLKLNLKEY